MNVEPRSLTEMQNRLTAYEVVVTANDGTQVRLAFTERKTKNALLQIAQKHGDALIAMLGDWDGDATYSKAAGWTFGPIRVHFTGRTERDLATIV